jgi:hypothetical protein
MKMNRIQFQPDLSLNQFRAEYGTQEQCESVLEHIRGQVYILHKVWNVDLTLKKLPTPPQRAIASPRRAMRRGWTAT